MTYFYGSDLLGYGMMLLAVVITIVAEVYVKSSFNKYKKIKVKTGLSGFEVARQILDANGLSEIYITETQGILSDHYDPQRKVVRLSSDIFHGDTIASYSVASHEVGHAIQDKEGYFFIKLRGFIFPFVNISSKFGYFAILIGFIFGYIELAWIGVGLEIVILFFQLITLPVEFNASKRALVQLRKMKFLTPTELNGSEKMLKSAALTYVASLATTVLEVLRLILILGRNSDN